MTEAIVASGLAVEYRTAGGAVRALDGVDLAIPEGQAVGVIGESGSGKTTLGMAMGRLLPANASRVAGSLWVDRRPVFDLDEEAVRDLRRSRLGFVFQNPMSALNPTARIGAQMRWALARAATDEEVCERLAQTGLRDVARVTRAYPHELSGGMAQRVVIAMSIARRPALLIADEPTASLDASIRGRILDLIRERQREIGATLILLSHELSLVARHCSRVVVMYGGRIVETGPARETLHAPIHPYTRALLSASPGRERPGERLQAIPGAPAVLRGASEGCAFAARCPLADEICRRERPATTKSGDRELTCHHVDRLSDEHRP